MKLKETIFYKVLTTNKLQQIDNYRTDNIKEFKSLKQLRQIGYYIGKEKRFAKLLRLLGYRLYFVVSFEDLIGDKTKGEHYITKRHIMFSKKKLERYNVYFCINVMHCKDYDISLNI